MTFRSITKAAYLSTALSTIMLFLAAGQAQAALFFSFEARETYEDNASGIVTDAGVAADGGAATSQVDGSGGRGRDSPVLRRQGGEDDGGGQDVTRTELVSAADAAGKQGDFSTDLYADLGVINRIAGDRSLTASASVQHAAYARFDELDFTILKLSAGLTQQLSDIVSARLTVYGKTKYYENPLRDSLAAGLTASLRERLGRSVRFRQVYDFERNSAESPGYSFYRHSIGISASVDLTRALLLDVGYSYLLQEYDDPASRVTTRMISAELERVLGRGWGLTAGFDREMSRDNASGLSWTNNILSAGIRYLY